MNIQFPTLQRQHVMLAVVLLLLGQFVSSLHHHETTQPTLDTDDCIICLIGTAGADASPFAPKLTALYLTSSILFFRINNTVIHSTYNTTNHSRAPPFFS